MLISIFASLNDCLDSNKMTHTPATTTTFTGRRLDMSDLKQTHLYNVGPTFWTLVQHCTNVILQNLDNNLLHQRKFHDIFPLQLQYWSYEL